MSSDRQQLEINKTANEVDDVACASCRRLTKHIVLASADLSGQQYHQGILAVEYSENYQVIQCKGCETISFRIRGWNSEDYDIDDGGLSYNITTSLYPSRSEGRTPLKDSHLLPVDVQRIYGETIKAMNNEQPVLAGIGIRAIVESICRDRQATKGNLLEKIDALVPLGVLTKDGADILHKVRSLGNEAAHEVKPHTMEQLGLAIDVCEHLFLGVYLLPHHAKATFR
ncbi:MAG TPA: DUF4145 domain-containing protein [Steroidobacter sp.]|uniref:DUF4145 domain-containing protein n=1 Tax=Steroidobacter sp. TaxID=1978227 RepID=UPI002ED7F224